MLIMKGTAAQGVMMQDSQLLQHQPVPQYTQGMRYPSKTLYNNQPPHKLELMLQGGTSMLNPLDVQASTSQSTHGQVQFHQAYHEIF